MRTVCLYDVRRSKTRQIRMIIRLSLRVNNSFRFLFRPCVADNLRRRRLLLILRLLFDLIYVNMCRSYRREIILNLRLTSEGRRSSGTGCPYSRAQVLLCGCNMLALTTLHRHPGTYMTVSPLLLSVVPTIALFRASLVM